MEKFRRIFVVVMDSLGVGEAEDAAQFGDVGSNTLGHISQSVETFKIPHLRKLGMANLTPLKQVEPEEQPLGYYGKLREKSLGKDTMTGHWEMMGLEVKTPFKTFTETGFPPELIPVTVVKMFSSSAATGLLLDIYKEYGADSMLGKMASIMMSSTETIFYTMSVYFMAAGIKKSRYTLVGALIATTAGTVASIILAGYM